MAQAGIRVYSQAYSDFAEAVRALRGGKGVASERQIVADRNLAPAGTGPWDMYGFTRSARIYSPDEEPIWILDSPLLNQEEAQKAVDGNREGKRYHITKECYQDVARRAKHRNGAMQLPSRTSFSVSLDENLDVLEFAVGKRPAKTYLKRLRDEKDINSVQFCLIVPDNVDKVDIAKGPFVQQSWFYDRADGSYLGDLDLHYGKRTFEVRRSSDVAQGHARQISAGRKSEHPYNPRELNRVKKIIEEIRAGRAGYLSLEEVAGFLERL